MKFTGAISNQSVLLFCLLGLWCSFAFCPPSLALNVSNISDSQLEGLGDLGGGQTVVISCLGDSVTEGVPYSGTEYTYPAQLQVMLDAAYGSSTCQVINHGVGGDRAEDVLDDLQNLNWMVNDQPRFVLLMVGGNDLSDANFINFIAVVAQTVSEVQEIVDFINAHTNTDGSRPRLLVSAFIPNRIEGFLGSLLVSYYNSQLESQLSDDDIIWFTTNWDDFNVSGQANASLMSEDGVHPNSDGYLIMAENWFEALPSSPTVTNSVGATSITPSSARLNGEITDVGIDVPTVYVYWGDNDGGITSDDWDHVANLGTVGG